MSARRGSCARFHWWLVAGLAMALAGCAASGSSPAPTTVPVAPSTPTATLPAAATSPASSMPSPVATGVADEAWDLVWFSDSSVAGVPDLWAARIRKRLGIEVRVHTFPDGGGSVPRELLDAIDRKSDMRDAIAGAELIGLETVPAGTEPGQALLERCVKPGPPPLLPPPVYAVADLTEYAEQLRSILDRIFELRAGRPTIIRAMDIYTPVLDQWTAAGIEPACTAGFEAHSGTIKMVADEYGVTTASIYDLFNGPGHHEDPVDKCWIGEDGVHPSAAGTAAQLDLLDALGYEPIEH